MVGVVMVVDLTLTVLTMMVVTSRCGCSASSCKDDVGDGRGCVHASSHLVEVMLDMVVVAVMLVLMVMMLVVMVVVVVLALVVIILVVVVVMLVEVV